MSMHLALRWFVAILGAVCLAGCASSDRFARQAARLAQYEANAGEPVASIRTFRWASYETLGDHVVALWASPQRGWLITLRKPCIGLDSTRLIGIEQRSPALYAHFDRIVFRDFMGIDQRCEIETIRPLDAAGLRVAERGAD